MFKAGNRNILRNYRPISILSSFSKILEKVASLQLVHYFESNAILNSSQFGFRTNRSTELACHTVVRNIYSNFDSGNYTLGVFLDLAKAFDSLDRRILFKKLEHYGVRDVALEWFKSYFFNRQQYVSYNKATSNLLSIDYGVPQGSNVGPILFIIFINDLIKSAPNAQFVLFADDSSLFLSDPCLHSLVQRTNDALNNVKTWLLNNRLTLNEQKTEFIVFYRKQRRFPQLFDNICFGSSIIKRVRKTKFLGLHIDENLSWVHHVAHVSRVLSKFTGILYKVAKSLTVPSRLLIYNSLIYPNLLYCLSLWGFTRKIHLDKINVAQKKIIRLIAGVPFRDHTAPIFDDLKLMKMESCSVYMCLLLVFKVMKFNNNYGWFHAHENVAYNTRSSSLRNLVVPFIRTTHSRQSIDYTGSLNWNLLPSSLKNAEDYNRFRRLLKRHLLEKQRCL